MLDMTVRGFTLRFLENLWRRKMLFLLPVVLTGAAGFYLASGADTYQSEGVVLVDSESFLASLTDVREEGFSFRTPSDLADEHLFGLLSTNNFIEAIVAESGIEAEIRSPGSTDAMFYDSVRRAIWSSSGGENFLTIAAEADDPEIAQLLATATIETFVLWEIGADLDQARLAEEFVDDLVQSYEVEIEEAQAALSDWVRLNPGPSRIEDRPIDEQLELQELQLDLTEASSRQSTAITQREGARLASAQAEADVRQSFAVVDSPDLATEPENGLTDLLLATVMFAMAGLALSTAVLVVVSATDSTIRFPSEVEALLGAEVLAIVPKATKVAKI